MPTTAVPGIVHQVERTTLLKTVFVCVRSLKQSVRRGPPIVAQHLSYVTSFTDSLWDTTTERDKNGDTRLHI